MGQTWTIPFSLPLTTNNINSIFMTSGTTGVAVSEDGEIFSLNANTWTLQNSGVNADLNCIVTVDSVSYAVGTLGTILKDGGAGWQSQNSMVNNKLTGVYFVSEDSGMVCGTDGIVLATIDGGNTWNIVLDDVEQDFNSISGTNDSIYVVGNSGLVYQTFDFGNTWGRFSTGNLNNANSIYLKARRGWVGAGSGNGLTFALSGFDASSLVEKVELKKFMVSPNPTSNLIYVSKKRTEQKISALYIVDLTGRVVISNILPNEHGDFISLDIPGIESGVYLLKVFSEQEVETTQIVKQ
jgi:hypothetical protein